MDLRSRLARLDRTAGRAPAGPPPDPSRTDGTLRELGLVPVTTAAGTIWRTERRRDLPPPDPLPSLYGFFARDPGLLEDPRQLLFLDTETTGLAGGTGTIPFLIGMAWWEGCEFVVQQWFLADPGGEPALLAAVDAAAAGRQVVVTYNGASFDLPLLRSRALLNRRRTGLDALTSWDLVVPARRLWRRILADCRQQSVEEHVRGAARGAGDIPGWRIPQVWFDFLADGDGTELAAVLLHNRRDMEGMAEILGAVCSVARDLRPRRLPWREAWVRALVCERRGQEAEPAGWIDLARGEGAALAEPAFVSDAVRVHKRRRRWRDLGDLIDGALAAGTDPPWLQREAAILREHRLPDFHKALAHALAAGDDHRVARLRRRIAAGDPGEEPT